MAQCCCDPCCPDATLLFGPGRTSMEATVVVRDTPVMIEAFGLRVDDCVSIERVDDECGVNVSRQVCGCECLVECSPTGLLRVPGKYRLVLSGPPGDDPAPDAVFVRATALTGEVLTAALACECCEPAVSYGMLGILRDADLFGELLAAIVSDPVARCVLVRALVSGDAGNSIVVTSDCGLFENDGVAAP